MKFIVYIDFEKALLGKPARKAIEKVIKRKNKKWMKKGGNKTVTERWKKKSIKIICDCEKGEVKELHSYWNEMFEGELKPKTEKDMKMSLKDKAQLARGKMTKGVQKKSIWLTKHMKVKYLFEVKEE